MFSEYLLELIGMKNLEQLWKVLKFLDRYCSHFIMLDLHY